MIYLLPALLLFLFFIFLFVREIELDKKRLLEEKRVANDHVLREVERFVKEQESMRLTQVDE